MEEFEHLSLSRTTSIEDLHGFQLVDGVPITPPLVPAPSPTSPSPAPLASPQPALQSSPPPPRTAHNWTAGELELAVGTAEAAQVGSETRSIFFASSMASTWILSAARQLALS